MDTQDNALGIGVDYFHLSSAQHRQRREHPALCYFCGRAGGSILGVWVTSLWHPKCIETYIDATDTCPICDGWRATEGHHNDRPCAYADYQAGQEHN